MIQSGHDLAAWGSSKPLSQKVLRLLVPDLADWCLIDIAEEDGRVNQLAAAHADPEKEILLIELGEHGCFPAECRGMRRSSARAAAVGSSHEKESEC